MANPSRRKAKTGTKGKGAQKGQGMRMPRKEGKAQESMKGEEEKPNERGKEDSGDERKPDLWSIFKLHPLCSGLPLPHNRTNVSNSTEHDLTALRTALTTRQEALDQPWLRLAARQEGIEGTDERAKEVQRAVEYRQEAVGQREAIGQRGKEMEERQKAVEWRKREV